MINIQERFLRFEVSILNELWTAVAPRPISNILNPVSDLRFLLNLAVYGDVRGVI